MVIQPPLVAAAQLVGQVGGLAAVAHTAMAWRVLRAGRRHRRHEARCSKRKLVCGPSTGGA